MDMMALLSELKARLPETEFVYYDPERPADALLVLNACQVQCASRPAFSGPTLVVSPQSIDYWPIPSEQLCDALCQRLLALNTLNSSGGD